MRGELNGKMPVGIFWCDKNVLYLFLVGSCMGIYIQMYVKIIRTENLRPLYVIVYKLYLSK